MGKFKVAIEQLDKKIAEKEPIQVISFETTDRAQFPPRPFIVEPFIRERSIGMIFSQTGSGKTVFTMSLCMHIARGLTFLGWATKPKRVFYIDSEMEMDDMINLREWIKLGNDLEQSDNIGILNRSIAPQQFTNTMGKAWQDKIKAAAKDYDIVVFDNIATLFGTKDENKAESWEIVKGFLFELRFMGKSVIFLHHAGKGGKQRGTSARVDACDYVIRLDKLDKRPGTALCLKGSFEKGRRGDFESFGVNVHVDGHLEKTDLRSETEIQIIERYKDGASVEKVADAMGVSYRVARQTLKSAGVLKDRSEGAREMWRNRSISQA